MFDRICENCKNYRKGSNGYFKCFAKSALGRIPDRDLERECRRKNMFEKSQNAKPALCLSCIHRIVCNNKTAENQKNCSNYKEKLVKISKEDNELLCESLSFNSIFVRDWGNKNNIPTLHLVGSDSHDCITMRDGRAYFENCQCLEGCFLDVNDHSGREKHSYEAVDYNTMTEEEKIEAVKILKGEYELTPGKRQELLEKLKLEV